MIIAYESWSLKKVGFWVVEVNSLSPETGLLSLKVVPSPRARSSEEALSMVLTVYRARGVYEDPPPGTTGFYA